MCGQNLEGEQPWRWLALACPGGFFVSKHNPLLMVGGLNWLVGLAPREPTLNFEEDF